MRGEHVHLEAIPCARCRTTISVSVSATQPRRENGDDAALARLQQELSARQLLQPHCHLAARHHGCGT
eukprot:3684453-Prymnesium_polylepis.1